jgi:hypothetical protein
VGTTCKDLVNELGRKAPLTTKELLDITTNFASSKKAVGAIFSPLKAKRKRQEDVDKGGSGRDSKKKKKNNQRRRENLMVIAERKNNRPQLEGASGVFNEMLEKSCPYHQVPVKHTFKERGMMKCYFSRGAKGKGDQGNKPKEDKGNGGEKDDDFLVVNNYFMIFGGPVAYDSRRQRKLERQEVYAVKPATPAFLDWSGSAITFDHNNHPDHVP